MSAFENYTQTSNNYDQTRQAGGLEIIIGCLQAAGLDLNQSTLLDAGCGTGSYTKAILPWVKKIIGVDLNPGMLAQANRKLEREIELGQVQLLEGDLTQLDLQTASVDAAMMNQVLHHLPDSRQDRWQIRRKLFVELARVLRPGGVFILNASRLMQLRRGFWYYELIPQALDRTCARHLEHNEISDLFTNSGFSFQGCCVPVDTVLQGEHYFDTHGPHTAAWRNGDSIWADVSDQELSSGLAKLSQLHSSGKFDAFMAQRERWRLEVGQCSFFYGIREAD